MKRGFTFVAAIALMCAVAANRVGAQSLISMSARADNDAFDFWLAPYARPDEEYTSGVRGTLEYSGTSFWDRMWHRDLAPCRPGGLTRCATRSYSLGQDIYTGKLVPGDTTREAGVRPNAGWLFLQESSRIMTRDHLDESSLTIGITGPAALGEQMQKFFHGAAPDYNRPVNWSTQLPFEPGVVLAYDHTERVLAFGEGGSAIGGDVEPHGGVSVGNILTEARAGLRARVGIGLQHPWLLARKGAEPEISFIGDATIHGVLRNEFLAGTLFSRSERVDERPFITEYQAGVSVSVQHLTLSYMADQLGSEYRSRGNGHAWGRLAIEWHFER